MTIFAYFKPPCGIASFVEDLGRDFAYLSAVSTPSCDDVDVVALKVTGGGPTNARRATTFMSVISRPGPSDGAEDCILRGSKVDANHQQIVAFVAIIVQSGFGSPISTAVTLSVIFKAVRKIIESKWVRHLGMLFARE